MRPHSACRRAGRVVAAVVALAAVLCASAFGQTPLPGAPIGDVAMPVADTATPPPPKGQESPRAAVVKFLEAMNAVEAEHAERLPEALECIYLGEGDDRLPPDEAVELARQLYELIDYFTFQRELVPDAPDGETRDVEFTLEDEPEADDAEPHAITLKLHRYDDDVWRFPSSTLEAVPALHEELLAQAPPEVPPSLSHQPLRSPRAAMRTFIEGMNAWDEGGREDALSTLDLSEFPEEIREEQGKLLADYLKQILDRDRLVVYQEIHDAPDGEPYVHLSHKEGKVVLAPVTSEEGGRVWKFSAKTLDTLPALYKAYKQRAVVTGVQDSGPRVLSLQLRAWVEARVPFLLEEAFLLENWQWLGLFAIILAGMGVSRLITMSLVLLIRRRFRRNNIPLDPKLEASFVRPIRMALMAWVWYLGLHVLGLPPTTLFYLRAAAKTISAAGVVWAAYRLIDIAGRFLGERARRSDNKFDDVLVPMVVRSLKIFVVTFGVVIVAETIGFDYKGLLAGLGLGGLAFALAAKDTVSNIFGSLTILLDRPFQIGDWVVIGQAEGSVESVGIRSTRIRTFYNSLIAVPNASLINATIDNMGARRYRRFKTMLALTYDTPPEKVEAFCEGVRQLIRAHPYTRKDYYHCWLNEFDASSINVLLYCFHDTPDWGTELRERHRLMLDVMRLAKRLGVQFAFPTQTLHLHPETDHGSVPPERGPRDAEEAFERGRNVADQVVAEGLGPDAPPPPPVAFDPPGE